MFTIVTFCRNEFTISRFGMSFEQQTENSLRKALSSSFEYKRQLQETLEAKVKRRIKAEAEVAKLEKQMEAFHKELLGLRTHRREQR